jgi:murein DD-endopeptidase MepM/ murein hydrolase activator NlpD
LEKFLVLFLFSLHTSAQLAAPAKITLDSALAFDNYWQHELSPLTDLYEIVNYIHRDPFNAYFIKEIPAGNPLKREIGVNSFYGARNHPIHKVQKFHAGIDLKGRAGEEVVSSGNGLVVDLGTHPNLGKFVKIKHQYGFESIYGHLSKINVKKGQKVAKDQLIGLVGATGKVTGPHLHYTLKKNQTYLDPFDFLFMNFEKLE